MVYVGLPARQVEGSECRAGSPTYRTPDNQRFPGRTFIRTKFLMFVRRIVNMWKTAGPGQALRFLARRVLRTQRHVVYSMDVTEIDEPVWDPETELHVISDAEGVTAHQAIAHNLETRNMEYLEGIRRGEVIGVFVLNGGTLVHWGFILMHTKTACLLGVDPGAPFVANAFTEPSFRGRGLQKRSLRQRLYECRNRGFPEVYTETHPDNVASWRAMERVGLSFLRDVTLIVLLTRFVVRMTHSGRPARTFGWC